MNNDKRALDLETDYYGEDKVAPEQPDTRRLTICITDSDTRLLRKLTQQLGAVVAITSTTIPYPDPFSRSSNDIYGFPSFLEDTWRPYRHNPYLWLLPEELAKSISYKHSLYRQEREQTSLKARQQRKNKFMLKAQRERNAIQFKHQ